MADPTTQEVQDVGQFPNTNGIAIALSVAINQVTEILLGVTISVQTLHDIKMYLAAHYTDLSQNRGAIIQNRLAEAREDYAHIYSSGLFSTRYGQMVAFLDTSGRFRELAAKTAKPTMKATFTVISPQPFVDGEDPKIL